MMPVSAYLEEREIKKEKVFVIEGERFSGLILVITKNGMLLLCLPVVLSLLT